VLGNVREFEQKAFDEMPLAEKRAALLLKEGKKAEASKELSRFSKDFAAATVQRWKEMEIRFWEMFGRGF